VSTGQIVAGVLAFAAVTAVLYVWGLRKSMAQPEDLRRILTGKCADRVVKYLRKNGTVTEKEIVRQVSGVRAGQFWSKKQVAVQEPKKFAAQLTEYLLSQQIIESAGRDGYRLRRK
jgi:hypothetical protein